MADNFGALTFPVPVPAAGSPVGDPGLEHIGRFARAVLLAECNAAWRTRSREDIVKSVFFHDPEKADVSTTDFPSLYLWRTRPKNTHFGPERVETTSTVNILWLYERETQKGMASQSPIVTAIHKALSHWFHLGRHPAWRVTGDPDATAATRGSLLWRHAQASQVRVISGDDETIVIELFAGGKPIPCDGYLIRVEMNETSSRDPAQYARTITGADARPSAMTTDITTPGEDPAVLFNIRRPTP